MKEKLFAVTVLLLAVSVYPVAAAYPTLTGYVNDFAGLLTTQERASLAEQAGMVDHNTTVQIAIITVQTTNGEDTILYGAHTGEQNGVGQKATDNGVVIVYSVAEGGGIATGRGIESTLTDYWVSNTGRNAHQYFVNGKYYDGFSYLISEIDKRIEPGNVSTAPGSGPASEPAMNSLLLVIGIVVIGFIAAFVGALIFGGRESETEYTPHDHTRDAVLAASMGSVLLDRHHHHDDDDDSSNSSFHSTWSDSGGHSGGFGGFGGGGFGGGGGHF